PRPASQFQTGDVAASAARLQQRRRFGTGSRGGAAARSGDSVGARFHRRAIASPTAYGKFAVVAAGRRGRTVAFLVGRGARYDFTAAVFCFAARPRLQPGRQSALLHARSDRSYGLALRPCAWARGPTRKP